MRRSRIAPAARLCLLGLLVAFSTAALASEFANIQYLCCDWGPAMTLPAKKGEQPQFNEAEEEIYFLKQTGRFTRKLLPIPDVLSGNNARDEGRGISIYLCKMKPDGSDKTEIKELWRNPNYPLDTQGQSTWMDVNRKTRKIVVSVMFAGTDVMGLWTMNLDGSEFRQIIRPEWGERLVGFDHPSWTPDGEWIVFEECLRGVHPKRFNIAICDTQGQRLHRLFEATETIQYRQPSVSPDGKRIAFAQYPYGYPGGRVLWLANIDGSDAHPLLDDKGKMIFGMDPAWRPDGKSIYVTSTSSELVDVATGRVTLDHRPMLQGNPQGTCGWPHWGRTGFVGSSVGGILFTDLGMQEAHWIGSSKLVQCAWAKESCRW